MGLCEWIVDSNRPNTQYTNQSAPPDFTFCCIRTRWFIAVNSLNWSTANWAMSSLRSCSQEREAKRRAKQECLRSGVWICDETNKSTNPTPVCVSWAPPLPLPLSLCLPLARSQWPGWVRATSETASAAAAPNQNKKSSCIPWAQKQSWQHSWACTLGLHPRCAASLCSWCPVSCAIGADFGRRRR